MSGTREPVTKTGDLVEGRYRVLRTLGEGGMGTVFLAEHALIHRRVALKILHRELATEPQLVDRFMNEARAAGTLGHPNIVESTDMGFTRDGVPYIVFEYLEGALLTDEIYRVEGFPVRRAVWIARQIASALHAAHTASIVHRDLKSDNVFLTDKDEALDHVKVLDFGISRFLELDDEASRGVVMGTPEFMAPEQITAPDHVDRRADIYALGVILYEMLTARRPFRADDDPRALLDRIVHTPPPPLGRDDVPYGLSELILHRMLAKDPADRLASMNAVEAALAAYATQREAGGLRRSRTATLDPGAFGVLGAAEVRGTPVPVPAPRVARIDTEDLTAGSAPRVARVDTDDQVTASAVPDAGRPGSEDDGARVAGRVAAPRVAPAARRPWLLYAIAGGGLAVGALGLVIGGRGRDRDDPAPSAARVVAPLAAAVPVPAAEPPPPPVAIAPAPVPVAAPRSKVELRIEANAPGARVMFRRAVTAAPLAMEVPESDIVEVVELAAPGYKTQRYWLTCDRPTHLTARLVKGRGVVEASDEETLIALGELAAPAPVVVAAAPARAPSRGSAPRRRIGRAAAEAIAARPGAAEPAAPAVDPAPAVEPAEPVPAFAAEPAVGTPAVAELAKPADPTEALRAALAAHQAEIDHCGAEGRQLDPSLTGTLRLALEIGGDGQVVQVQPDASFDAPGVVACATKLAAGWSFAAYPGGPHRVSYPFHLR